MVEIINFNVFVLIKTVIKLIRTLSSITQKKEKKYS